MMKRLFKYFGCTLLIAPALAWADNKAAVDWTPFLSLGSKVVILAKTKRP